MQAWIDLDEAKRSRKWHTEHSTDAYYNEQSHILAQWVDKLPPVGLIMGELPCVGLSQIRLDRD